MFGFSRREMTIALSLLLAIGVAVGVAVYAKATSEPASAEPPAAPAEAQAPDRAPTDEIQYVSVKPERAAAAREQVSTAFAKAQRMEREADIETKPGEVPPASAGDNGTYDEPSARSRRIKTASMSGVNGLSPEHSALLLGRMAIAPPSAPTEVKQAISAANAIVGRPYVWGGGHGSWNDNGYDCSGAVSYALGGAGLLGAPLNSTGLMDWGEPGPGKWITVYANHEHTYAVIAGLRWDTVGQQRGTGPKWHAQEPYPEGYVVRHPPGL